MALVMNGGVSLAVWMGGVTHEIDNCRRASVPDELPSRVAWSKLMAAAKTNVTVDVIAGTSAGGLNGAVLARAIAQDQSVPDVKRLWLGDAALKPGKLLWPTPNPSASLLNGKHFLEAADTLLSLIPSRADSNSTTRPTVTLLVTATALPIRDGRPDPGGRERDSRRVYRFRSRAGVSAGWAGIDGLPEVAELRELDDIPTLALATRASASFPAAFQPVWESDELRLRQVPRPRAGSRWLMDGGVLDNAPFEPLLDELRQRAVTDVFDRAIVYINPSAPNIIKPRQDIKPGGPGIITTLAAFASASREPDRRLDRERLNEARDAIGYTETDPDRVLATIFRTADDGHPRTDAIHRAAAALMPNYRASRRQVLFLTASSPLSAPNSATPRSATERHYPAPPSMLVPNSCEPTVNASWRWGLTAADRMLRWWDRALSRQNRSEERRNGLAALGKAQLLVRQWSDSFDDTIEPHRGDVVDWYVRAQRFFAENNLPSLLNALMITTAHAIAPALGTDSGMRVLHATLDLEVVSRALAWRTDSSTDVPDFDLLEITPEAPHPCDLGAAGGDPRWPIKKLYGDQWGHFGAFATERGRRWDWLWGRLDAAMIISDHILTRAGMLDEIATFQAELAEAILSEELRAPDVKDAPTNQVWLSDEAQRVLDEENGRTLWQGFVRADRPSQIKNDRLLAKDSGTSITSPGRQNDPDALRNNLLTLASTIPGAAIPRRWPDQIHALLDDQKTWNDHRPHGLTLVKVLPFWAIGRVGRAVAARRLRKMLEAPIET